MLEPAKHVTVVETISGVWCPDPDCEGMVGEENLKISPNFFRCYCITTLGYEVFTELDRRMTVKRMHNGCATGVRRRLPVVAPWPVPLRLRGHRQRQGP